MKKTHVLLLLTGFLWLVSACKSEFERVRISGDAKLILNKAFYYYEKEEYQKSQTLFDLVLNTIRGDKDAEKAYFYYAYTYYYLKQYTLAAYYFKNFSNTFTSSAFREEAAYMSAYSNYLLSPTFRLDQGNTRHDDAAERHEQELAVEEVGVGGLRPFGGAVDHQRPEAGSRDHCDQEHPVDVAPRCRHVATARVTTARVSPAQGDRCHQSGTTPSAAISSGVLCG